MFERRCRPRATRARTSRSRVSEGCSVARRSQPNLPIRRPRVVMLAECSPSFPVLSAHFACRSQRWGSCYSRVGRACTCAVVEARFPMFIVSVKSGRDYELSLRQLICISGARSRCLTLIGEMPMSRNRRGATVLKLGA